MTILMLRHAILVPVLLGSCVAATAADLPGQQGPTTALLQGGPLQLSTRRTAELFPDGNRIWKVELHLAGAPAMQPLCPLVCTAWGVRNRGGMISGLT